MNKRILGIIGLISLGFLIFWGGGAYAQSRWTGTGWQSSWMGGGMMNGGMMGNGMGIQSMFGNWGGLTNVDPLSIEETETAVTSYLAALNKDNLAVGEIMIFENQAYAQIIDTTTR